MLTAAISPHYVGASTSASKLRHRATDRTYPLLPFFSISPFLAPYRLISGLRIVAFAGFVSSHFAGSVLSLFLAPYRHFSWLRIITFHGSVSLLFLAPYHYFSWLRIITFPGSVSSLFLAPYRRFS